MARDPGPDRLDPRAATGARELRLDERLEAVGRAIARIEQVLDRLAGQVVRGEARERGEIGDDPPHLDLGAVFDLEPALDIEPDALADIILRRDAREMLRRVHAGVGGEDALLGDGRRLELEQHVGGSLGREGESGVDGDGHIAATYALGGSFARAGT
ncbi:hypothetical protein J4558_24820 [Leptolyngbya sp. 15MV]|nr:hypothetical protein J4558_24820 [Leptolyngbya sp. 15MV]